MPYPPQPYPPLTRPERLGCVDTHQVHTPSLGPAELNDMIFETMAFDNEGRTPHDATLAEKSTKDDAPMRAASPAVVQDTPETTVDRSDCHSVSLGPEQGAYIWPSTSLDAIPAPLVSAENYSDSSAASVLDSPMDTEHDGATVHSEHTTGFGFNCDTASSALGESISRLLYAVAFSHLSGPRCTSLPAAMNGALSQINSPLSLDQDMVTSCTDGLSDEQLNLSLLTESVSAPSPGSISPLSPSSPGFTRDCFMECSYGTPVLTSPLPSSPVPSSSPPNFFTSSPTPNPPGKSPLTSPVPTGKPTAAPLMMYGNPLKRPRSPHTTIGSADGQDDVAGEPAKKQKKVHTHEPPQPKRSTHLSQHRQYAKLKTPFRSPVTTATKGCPRYKDTAPSSEPDLPSSPAPFGETIESNPSQKPEEDAMVKVRTPRASGQFKSPLSAVSGPGAGRAGRGFSAAPNVQALQSRIQTLKRAIKIRNGGEGEKLERLANKWTGVAREVAWEVWSVVKDNVQDVSKLGDRRGGFQNSWGWEGEERKDGATGGDRPGGEDEVLSEEDEPPVPEDTMSVMLRKMGIDPSTLGWDEEEGEFIDISC